MKWSVISTAYLFLWLFVYSVVFLHKFGSDEVLSITLSKDDEEMIYEDPMEWDMIVPSPYQANGE